MATPDPDPALVALASLGREAAAALGVKPALVRTWRARGAVPSAYAEALSRALAAKAAKAPAPLTPEAPEAVAPVVVADQDEDQDQDTRAEKRAPRATHPILSVVASLPPAIPGMPSTWDKVADSALRAVLGPPIEAGRGLLLLRVSPSGAYLSPLLRGSFNWTEHTSAVYAIKGRSWDGLTLPAGFQACDSTPGPYAGGPKTDVIYLGSIPTVRELGAALARDPRAVRPREQPERPRGEDPRAAYMRDLVRAVGGIPTGIGGGRVWG